MVTLTDRRLMARPTLERFLAGLPPFGEGAATLYAKPDSPRVSLDARLRSVIPGQSAGAAAALAAGSETGAVLLWDPPRGYLVVPPFPISHDALYPGRTVGPLLELLAEDRVIGVLLLRLGRYAVGVYQGAALVSSKTGSRYVKGRHHAGGTSQQRFARIREKQVAELFKEACGVLQQRLGPYTDRLEQVFLGGERFTLLAFRRRCPYLERFGARIRRRILHVGEPSLIALETLPRQIATSQVYLIGEEGIGGPP